jgi:hypothetical protein
MVRLELKKEKVMKKFLLLGLCLSAMSLQLFGIHYTYRINLMSSFFAKNGTYRVRIWDTATPRLPKSNVRFTFTVSRPAVGEPNVLTTSSKDITIRYTTDNEIIEETKKEMQKVSEHEGVQEYFEIPAKSMDASTVKVREAATLYVPVGLHCMKQIEIIAEEGDLAQQKATATIKKGARFPLGCNSRSWKLRLDEGGKMNIENNIFVFRSNIPKPKQILVEE